MNWKQDIRFLEYRVFAEPVRSVRIVLAVRAVRQAVAVGAVVHQAVLIVHRAGAVLAVWAG